MKLFRIQSSQLTSPTALHLVLEPVTPSDQLKYEAGQYAAIRFRRNGRPTPVRCFSIVSSPLQPHRLEFGIRLSGTYTRALARLEPGEVIEVMGAYGEFVLPAPRPERLVMLAGGIGVTPFISQIRTALARPTGPQLTLVHAISSAADAPFYNELVRLSRQFPGRFKVVYAVGDANTAPLRPIPAAPGRLTPAIIESATGQATAGQTFMVCGPPGFMQAVTKQLRDGGVERRQIISEAFSQTAGDRGSTKLASVRVYAAAASLVAAVILAVIATEFKETADQIEAQGSAPATVAVATVTPTPPTPTPALTPAPTAEPEEAEEAGDDAPVGAPAPTARPIIITPAPTPAPVEVPVSQPPRSGVS